MLIHQTIFANWLEQQLPHKSPQALNKMRGHMLCPVSNSLDVFASENQDPLNLKVQYVAVHSDTTTKNQKEKKQTSAHTDKIKKSNIKNFTFINLYLRTCSNSNNSFHKLQKQKVRIMYTNNKRLSPFEDKS